MGDKISLYAQKHNFHVRREKHAIVCSNAFYAEHLEWFYGRTFDVQLARQKVGNILDAVKTKQKEANLKKQKLLKK
jgi:hypothetical protein